MGSGMRRGWVVGLALAACAPTPAAAAGEAPGLDRPSDDHARLAAAASVIDRVAPEISARFVLRLERAQARGGSFTIGAEGNKISIAGSDTVALLSGFRYYLSHIASGSIGRGGDVIPAVLPLPDKPISRRSGLAVRNAYNFTVAGYTFPYWQWDKWEREIDLLALSGINSALVTIGQEAVWYDTWRQLGWSDAEARAWISLPAHQPWQSMSNLSGFGGGYPKGLLEKRVALGQRIIARMRELGIEPILPGFAGMVPDGFPTRVKGSHVVPQGDWFGFKRPDWLDPSSPAFASTARLYYANQQARFGYVRDQAIDVLHEGGRAEGVDVAAAGRAIAASLDDGPRRRRWIIQAWGGNPRRDLVTAIPDDNVLVEDLVGDDWIRSDRFWGKPWIWGDLPNFGGRQGLIGDLRMLAATIPTLSQNPMGNLRGVTNMSEGVDTNPVYWTLFADAIWEQERIDLGSWTRQYAKARYGVENPDATDAWLRITALSYQTSGNADGGADSLFNAAPDLEAVRASPNARTALHYDNGELRAALRLMLAAYPRLKERQTYRHDLVDLARQVAVNSARNLLPQLSLAYRNRDLVAFDRLASQWFAAMDLTAEMMTNLPDHSLSAWVRDARGWSEKKADQDSFEFDAKSLVTVWGSCDGEGPVNNDYANRDWSELISGYYKPRWAGYLGRVRSAIVSGSAMDKMSYCKAAMDWSRRPGVVSVAPIRSLDETALQIADLN